MRIYSIDNTTFESNTSKILKGLMKLSNEKKFTEIKPIKNYAQYLKEYGLDINRKK